MNKNYKVGIYLRLSKEDEKLGESGSITNQRAILKNYIQEHQLEFISEYIDDGVSGTTFDRQGFNRMIQDIENNKINMVITKDTSRLGRDHIEFGYYVEKYFPEHNVRYVAVCDNIDTFYNNNDMLLFKSAYNDMYVKDISNKIRASLIIKKRNGEFVGAYAPYGYQKDKNDKHKLIIDEPSANIVKKIFQMFVKGFSITKIAHTLTSENIPIPSIYKNMNRGLKSPSFGIWTQRTITDIITNPTYMGNLTQGRSKKINYKSKKRVHTSKKDWITKENSCPAIIEKDLFQMVQNIYYVNKNRCQKKEKTSNNLLLKGLVFCKECSHTIGFRRVSIITKEKETNTRIYGNCNYYLKHRNEKICTPHNIKYQELESIILKEVRQKLQQLNKDYLINQIKKESPYQQSLENKRKEQKKLETEVEYTAKKIDQLYMDRLNGLIDKERYLRVSHQILEEKNRNQKKIEWLKKELQKKREINYKKIIEESILKEKPDRLLLTSIIDKITISENKRIEIYYKIKNETFESISCDPFLK